MHDRGRGDCEGGDGGVVPACSDGSGRARGCKPAVSAGQNGCACCCPDTAAGRQMAAIISKAVISATRFMAQRRGLPGKTSVDIREYTNNCPRI